PSVLNAGMYTDYIRPFIKIEIGPRSIHDPYEVKSATNFIETHIKKLTDTQFDELKVKVLSPVITFTEKLFILHAYTHIDQIQSFERKSRHFYDVYKLSTSDMFESIIDNFNYIDKVFAYNKKFFPKEK